MNKSLILSVHQLVDFLLRKGDIDNRVFNCSTMTEGSKIHSSYQASQNSATYISEYPLKTSFMIGNVHVILQGRADGIIKTGYRYIIDEIKTTVTDLQTFHDEQLEWHLGQAKCYAFMFAKEKEQDNIGIRLTYIKQGKEKEKLIEDYVFFTLDLEQYVKELIQEYIDFYNIVFRHLEERKKTCEEIAFPFDKYRSGQRKLSELVYGVATKGGNLFVEAPTGIGKTMSTLYPYIKSLAKDDNQKIFYLTAKGSGKEAASNAIKILRDKGLAISEILITAKDKICFCKGKACNPDECPFAKNYYSKIQGIIEYALMTNNSFDYQTIVDLAYDNVVCPFELQLDLSLYCDVIICDYNYVFDPTAYLRRYLDSDSTHYAALVDEAHNLVDRSREMYSAVLNYHTLLEAKKSSAHIKNTKLKNVFKKLKEMFLNFDICEEGNTVFPYFSDEMYKTLSNAYSKLQEISKEDNKAITKETTNLILEINLFNKIAELYDDNYFAYLHKENGDFSLHLYCLDASNFLHQTCEDLKATTFFSATMTPMEYYIDTLGGEKLIDPYICLPSPFDKDNLLLMIAPKVSIKYKNRESSYQQVVDYIESFVSNKVGNYFVYVPSYEYLHRLESMINLPEGFNCFFQEKDISEQERIAFLNNFPTNPSETNVGFLVIGGAFSEGIDLVDDRLIGAIVIGVGIPKINFESDKIASHFEEKGLNGYEYAYLNPGMNKVMQAVGRVIRSETDRGAVLLIDERYLHKQYRALFKSEWSEYQVVTSPEEVKNKVSNFFNK